MSPRRLVYSSNKKKRAKEFKWKTYKPHFLDLIAANCTKDIEEAKCRVEVNKDGKYKYTPSKEYMRFLSKHCINPDQFNSSKNSSL